MRVKKIRRSFIPFVFITALIMAAPFKSYSLDEAGEEIKCFVGEVKIVPVNNPTRLAIGNPAIADVSSVSKSEVMLNPKSPGSTTFVVWDNYGEQAYRIKVFAEDTSKLKKRIDNLLARLNLPDVTTKAEDEEGKVVLLGSVKFVKDKDKISAALGQLKEKTIDLINVKEEEAGIEIDVQVVEVDKSSQDTLGFTWPGSVTFTEIGSAALSAGGTTWGNVFHVANVGRSIGGTANPFTLKLDALIQEGKARVLSRPRLVCQSGKEAKLVVGGEVPVLSGTVTPGTSGSTSVGATTGASVEYKEFGIILNIKPVLEDSGRVHLNLNVEVSEVGDTVQTTYALAYKITKRTASTELFLDDGQTMGIGGLIKKKSKEELRRVPWLSDVPVLGMFFKQKTSSTGGGFDATGNKLDDTELFITLTPRIMRPDKQDKELKLAPSSAPSPSDDNLADPVLKYSRIIQKKILDNLAYPASARKAGFQGTVKLSLKLSYQGELLDLKVKDSSQYQILDTNALRTAKKLAPYPPFPSEIKQDNLWVDIPIIYQLE